MVSYRIVTQIMTRVLAHLPLSHHSISHIERQNMASLCPYLKQKLSTELFTNLTILVCILTSNGLFICFVLVFVYRFMVNGIDYRLIFGFDVKAIRIMGRCN